MIRPAIQTIIDNVHEFERIEYLIFEWKSIQIFIGGLDKVNMEYQHASVNLLSDEMKAIHDKFVEVWMLGIYDLMVKHLDKDFDLIYDRGRIQ